MDYLHQKVEEAAFHEKTEARRAFRRHLTLVAEALRAIEWADSCDTAQGSEEAAIAACLANAVRPASAPALLAPGVQLMGPHGKIGWIKSVQWDGEGCVPTYLVRWWNGTTTTEEWFRAKELLAAGLLPATWSATVLPQETAS